MLQVIKQAGAAISDRLNIFEPIILQWTSEKDLLSLFDDDVQRGYLLRNITKAFRGAFALTRVREDLMWNCCLRTSLVDVPG